MFGEREKMRSKLYPFILRLLLVIGSGVLLTSCTQGEEADRTHLSDEQLLNEKVRYRIEGRKFAIPLAYHYWEKIRYKSWPRPKSGYRDVTTSRMLDAVLPDLLPYSQSTKHYFEEKQGQRTSPTQAAVPWILFQKPQVHLRLDTVSVGIICCNGK